MVTQSTVTGRGPVDLGDAATEWIQIGFGARGRVSGNTISDHDYTPEDWTACGLLSFWAGGALGLGNDYVNNERDVCTGGAGPTVVPRG